MVEKVRKRSGRTTLLLGRRLLGTSGRRVRAGQFCDGPRVRLPTSEGLHRQRRRCAGRRQRQSARRPHHVQWHAGHPVPTVDVQHQIGGHERHQTRRVQRHHGGHRSRFQNAAQWRLQVGISQLMRWLQLRFDVEWPSNARRIVSN